MKAKELTGLPEWNFNERIDKFMQSLTEEQKQLIDQAIINCFKAGIEHAYSLFDKAIQKDKINMSEKDAFYTNEKGHLKYKY